MMHSFLRLFLAFFIVLNVGSILIAQSANIDSLKLIVPVGYSTSAVLSNDGKYILSVSDDCTAQIWDISNGKVLHILSGHSKKINSAKFSNDSKYVITASDDCKSIVWNLSNGKILHIFEGHTAPVNYAEFSADTKMAISAASDGTVITWNMQSGLPDLTLRRFESSLLKKAVFSNDGKYLMGFVEDGRIYVWDIKKGNYNYESIIVDNIVDAVFSPDSKKILTLGLGKKVSIWDPKSGEKLFVLENVHNSIVQKAIFSPNSRYILTAGPDDFAVLWDASNGNFIRYIGQHKKGIAAIAFSSASELIISAGFDAKISIWETGSGKNLKNIQHAETDINYVCFGPGNKFFMTSGTDGYSKIWSALNGNEISSIGSRRSKISLIDFSDSPRFGFVIENGEVHVFDLIYGRNVFSIENDSVFYAEFSPDTKKLLTIGQNDTIKVWNIYTQNPLATFRAHQSAIRTAHFSPDSRLLITAAVDSLVKVWKLDGQSLKVIQLSNIPEYAIFSPSQSHIVVKLRSNLTTDPSKKTIRLWDCKNYKEIKINPIHLKFGIRGTALTKDLIFTSGADNKIAASRLVDAKENYIIATRHLTEIYQVISSKCGKYIASISEDGQLFVYETKTGSQIASKQFETFVSEIFFSNSSKYLISFSGSTSTIWDFESIVNAEKTEFEKVMELRGERLKFLENDQFFCSIDNDGKLTVWNSALNSVYSRIQLKNNNWLIKPSASSYYMCSRDAARMLHYIDSRYRIIGFEQLDPIFNRPDLVLEKFANFFESMDTSVISLYRKAFERRIARMPRKNLFFNEAEIAIPNVEITSISDSLPETTNDFIDISLRLYDEKYRLQSVNVWINEVPVYGTYGMDISHLDKQKLDSVLHLQLSIGENIIQIAATNELGFESYKASFKIKYVDKNVKSNLYFIGFGVSKFVNADKNLKYSDKDVEDLAAILSNFPNARIFLLKNEAVIKDSVLALKEILLKTTVHDKVILLASSHGLIDDNKDFYLATHNTNFFDPKINGLKYSDLESLLENIPARKKLMMIDACNSGEYFALHSGGSVSTNIEDFLPVATDRYYDKHTVFEILNELFINTLNKTGAHIISAARSYQDAFEGDNKKIKIQNSVFSYMVIEFLKNHENNPEMLSVKRLKNYVEKRVPELTNYKQIPTSRQETMEFDWNLKYD